VKDGKEQQESPTKSEASTVDDEAPIENYELQKGEEKILS
jgi:hypothetical protein